MVSVRLQLYPTCWRLNRREEINLAQAYASFTEIEIKLIAIALIIILCATVTNNHNQWDFREGRKASHNNFSSEPHSPHFLDRTTSKSSSFDCNVLKSYLFLKIKLILTNLATLGHRIWMDSSIAMINSCLNLKRHENDVKLYLGKT